MISPERLREISAWSADLDEASFEQARKGIIERRYEKGAIVCYRGDQFDYWIGVVSGLLKLCTTTVSGKEITLAGLRTGAWFGEGTVLKNEARQYELIALRQTDVALMKRTTFMWLFENSTAFNNLLIKHLNERLGQFIALVEYDRTLDATARLARNIAWLFNPELYPKCGSTLEVTQEEIGQLSGLSRQMTNKSLKILEDRGLLTVSYNSIAVRNLGRLRNFGE